MGAVSISTLFKAMREDEISEKVMIQRRAGQEKRKKNSRSRDWIDGKEQARGMKVKRNQS